MYRPYRRSVQIGVSALMFVVPILNLYEIYAVTGTFYSINFGGLGVADPSAIVQAVFASGTFAAPIVSAALLPVLLALVFGRVWCGWMCPYHVLADVASRVRSLFLSKALRRPRPEEVDFCRPVKANASRFGLLLVGCAVAGALGIPVLNYINAPGIISTEAMILVKERHLSVEFAFIAVLLLLEVSFLPRFWCRLFCPTGAVVSLLRTQYTLRVRSRTVNPKGPCCAENHCSPACPMGLEPFREAENLLCTNCGRCIDECRNGRLRFEGFNLTDSARRRSEQRHRKPSAESTSDDRSPSSAGTTAL